MDVNASIKHEKMRINGNPMDGENGELTVFNPYDNSVATATDAMHTNTPLQANATQKRLSAPVPGSYFSTDGGHSTLADNNNNCNTPKKVRKH